MTRKSLNLVIAAAVLVAAGSALAISRASGKPDEAEQPAPAVQSVVLSDFVYTDLRSVRTETSEGSLHLYSPDGENWLAADVPEFFRIDGNAAAAAVRAFARVSSTNIASEDGSGSPADFGLDPPEAVVTIRDREGGSAVLEIGSKSPTGTGRFARSAGSDTIVLIPSYIADRAFSTSVDYRDMNLPMVDPQALAGLSFRRSGITFLAEPRAEEDPFVSFVSPFDVISPFRGHYPLDDYELGKILTEEHPLPTRAAAYRDDLDPDNPEWGLDPESADLLSISDSNGSMLSLIIGASDGEGRRYAMYGDREDAVFLLNESDLALLDTDPFRLIGKFVFLGSITDVAQVKVEQGNRRWMMNRKEIGDPEDSKDDKFSIDDLEVPHKEFTATYQKFISLMWEGLAEEETPLGTPEIRITVSHDDPGVEKAVIRFWPYDDVYYRASVGDQPLEFLVGRYQVEDFIEDLAALAEFAS